jgi:hypothetical protein
MTDHNQQFELMRRFIMQEARACENANPEVITVFGRSLVDWLHPKLDAIGGVHISCMGDGSKVTVLVCRPMLDYEPTIMHFVDGGKLSEHKAVYFCPNAVLVVRPTEEGDAEIVNNTEEIAA